MPDAPGEGPFHPARGLAFRRHATLSLSQSPGIWEKAVVTNPMNLPNQRENEILSAVLTLPSSQRDAYLQTACAGDVRLRERIEALLGALEQASQLAAPADAATVMATEAERAAHTTALATEKTGDQIGHYKLLQQIGEGGCGVVYMAGQEEPVRRRVALKVIKLGMDTKNVIARFEAERQALAMMDHPNIARVLDAGSTANGRPFFVMELVRGIRITDYCDQNKLATADRLGLFIQVCHAIQHAHQKGIIHRDIKPSNILVTLHDGAPAPKVIDFGIAKATQGRLTEQTLFTAYEQFIGTPAYMSPEQAEMSGLDIDTRSDIYALGVLLYELLTGQTPFDAKELMTAGLDRMRQTIREQEPHRPSTRVSTMLDADRTTVTKFRQTDAPRLIHQLRGDLDWIVMKALEKDRTRRYDTVNDLALDVGRFLRSEPVLARPPSNLYRFQKLVHRHRMAFAAGLAVLVALAAGLGISTTLFIRERKARQRADAAERVTKGLLQEAIAGRELEKEMRLRAQMGEQFAAAGRLLGQQQFDRAEEIVAPLPTVKHGSPIYNVLGMIHASRGKWAWALTNYTKVVAVLPTEHTGYHALAPLLLQTGDVAGYERLREQMLRQFGETNVPAIAERMAKNCLILPPSPAQLATIIRMVNTAVAAGPQHAAWVYFQFVKGLAEFRAGRFSEAVEWLGPVTGQTGDWERAVQAHAVLAMSQHRLDKKDAARATLAQAIDLADHKLAKLDRGALAEQWHDWIIAHLLLREARELIERAGATGAKTN